MSQRVQCAPPAHNMKTTTIWLATLLALQVDAVRVLDIYKRALYHHDPTEDAGSYYSKILHDYHADVSPIYYNTRLRHPVPVDFDFGSFLPTLHDSTYHLPNYGGYDYSVPTGPSFEEGPVPETFSIIIESAQRRPQIPDPRLPVGARPPPRRILTNTNRHLFYRHPSYVPEQGGLQVTLPIATARPTRIVVPQHGVVAFGSGALGYATLPGGRIALGSGSVGLTNVAMARTNLLPPRPAAGTK